MSLRYRTEFNEAGDVLDPQAWNVNQNEFTSEFNGGLDRDNLLPACIDEARIVDNAFTKIHHTFGAASFSANTASRVWTLVPGSSISASFPQDCVVICEWGGTWQWKGAYTGIYLEEDAVAFRIVVDGAEITTSHYFGESQHMSSTYLVAAIPLSAGAHSIWAEIYFARVRQRDLQLSDADVSPSFDIDINEMLVEERRR